MTIPAFPDIELMLISYLVPANPSMRFATILPAGNPEVITARIHRTAGANRDIAVDRPVVDVDVFGQKDSMNDVSNAALLIQSQILSLMGAVLSNGVVQHATTVIGPRQLPEANPALVRYSASYEILVHS